MKHINIVSDLSSKGCYDGNCGECPVSCQTASKTAGALANQKCECKVSEKNVEDAD